MTAGDSDQENDVATIEERRTLQAALRACRTRLRVTQEELADALGISRKTYVLFESCRWLPSARERGHFVKELHGLDPAAAAALVAAVGETLEDHVMTLPSAAGTVVKPIDAKQAKLVFHAALYETAEELEMAPKDLRPIAAGLLAKLADSGITLAQAATLAKSAGTARKKE